MLTYHHLGILCCAGSSKCSCTVGIPTVSGVSKYDHSTKIDTVIGIASTSIAFVFGIYNSQMNLLHTLIDSSFLSMQVCVMMQVYHG